MTIGLVTKEILKKEQVLKTTLSNFAALISDSMLSGGYQRMLCDLIFGAGTGNQRQPAWNALAGGMFTSLCWSRLDSERGGYFEKGSGSKYVTARYFRAFNDCGDHLQAHLRAFSNSAPESLLWATFAAYMARHGSLS